MSVSAISSSAASYFVQDTSSTDKVGSSVDTLESTLDSGDLTGAKKAYADLLALFDTDSSSSDSTSSISSKKVPKELTDIGKALESGDIDSAKKILAKMEAAKGSQTPPPQPQTGGTDTTDSTLITSLYARNSDGSYNV